MKNKSKKVWSFVLIILVFILVLAFHKNINSSIINKDVLTFPYTIEKNNIELEIISVFSYTGTNPDFDDNNCEDVGSIQIINKSNKYLLKADLVVVLSNGNKLQFLLEDVPAGEETIAFEINNMMYDPSVAVLDINIDLEYKENQIVDNESIDYKVDEDNIIITNVSNNSLSNIIVKYHCTLNEMYFGGTSFYRKIALLRPKESTIIESDCLLGEVSVVDITY